MSSPDYVQAPTVARHRVLADVTVIDVQEGMAVPHQDVRITDDRIAAIVEHDPYAVTKSRAEADTEVIDASDHFVVPAFVDSHAHVLNHPDEVAGAHALMLAAGICGYRQMSGSDELLARRNAGTLASPVGSPRLLALPGDLLTPLNAGNERTTAATVRHQAQHGADFVKAAVTSAKTFMAALRAANEAGLPLDGHLPTDLDPREAITGGVRCIEHLGPHTPLAAASSSREEQVRAMERSLPTLPPLRFLGRFLTKPLLRAVVNPTKNASPQLAASYELAHRTFDEDKADQLVQLIVEHGTWNCPTLIRLHTQFFGDQPVHRDDERQKYIHPDELRLWNEASDTLAKLPQRTREALAEDLAGKMRLTRLLADAGAPLLAGTDANGAGWVIPGFALHDEFDLLAEAGLSPLTILRMATTEPARFLGREATAGRVAEGFDADLVLLDRNPLADHRALHDIAAVVRDGAYYSREALDGALARLEANPTAR